MELNISDQSYCVDTFEYNEFSELVSAHVGSMAAVYTYRPDGLRGTKSVNGTLTRHIWDGDEVSAELNADSSVKRTFTHGYAPATCYEGSDYYAFIRDRHGDVIKTVECFTESVIEEYDYDAYGNQRNSPYIITGDTNPYRYSGEYYDYETGFIYLRARYYDPSAGRFLTEDTHWNVDNMIFGDKEYKDGETKIPDITAIMQSNNLYAYGIGNPIMFVDPSGDAVELIVVALYAYAQAVLASPDLQFDMQMLAYDISQGDYVSAVFGLVDILAPGFSGSKNIPKFIRRYWDEAFQSVSTSRQQKAIDNILSNATFRSKTKGSTYMYDATGGYDAALKHFNSLNLSDVKVADNGTLTGTLANGQKVNLHASHTEQGVPTLQIGNKKIRYKE